MANSLSEDSAAFETAPTPRRRDGHPQGNGTGGDLAITAAYVALAMGGCLLALMSTGLVRDAAIVGVVAVAVAVGTRSGPTRIGLGLAFFAALSAPWNAVSYGGLRPGDLALVGAIGCLLLSRRSVAALPGLVLPAWLLMFAGVVTALTAAHELIPTSATYLAERVQVDAIGATTASLFTNLGLGGRWLVSLLGVPLLCVLTRQQGPKMLERLAMAYAAGAAVSGAVAVTDKYGITSISAQFIVPDSGGRQAGLTVHPNHLAATACLAVPFVIWMFSRGDRRSNAFATAMLIALLASVYESGSRGGAVCVVLAATLTLALVRRLRSRLPVVVGVLFGAMFVVFAIFPDTLAQLLTSVRLSNGAGVDASDEVRATLGAQGIADFRHSPFTGIGMQVALDAHNIFRQLLAAGGIILFGCFIAFAVGALRCALRVGRQDPLALAAMASISAWLLFGMVENLLTDRFLYVPIGIVVALAQRSPSPSPASGDDRQPAAALGSV